MGTSGAKRGRRGAGDGGDAEALYAQATTLAEIPGLDPERYEVRVTIRRHDGEGLTAEDVAAIRAAFPDRGKRAGGKAGRARASSSSPSASSRPKTPAPPRPTPRRR